MSSRTRKIMDMVKTNINSELELEVDAIPIFVVSKDGSLQRITDDLGEDVHNAEETMEFESFACSNMPADSNHSVGLIETEKREMNNEHENLYEPILNDHQVIYEFSQCTTDGNMMESHKIIQSDDIDVAVNDLQTINCAIIFEEDKKSENDNPEKDPDYKPAQENAPELINSARRSKELNRQSRRKAMSRRVKGKAYEGYKRSSDGITRTLRGAKEQKERCNHSVPKIILKTSFRCGLVTSEDRKMVFNQFWGLESWGEKKVFVRSLVNSRPIRRRRKDTQSSEKPYKKTEGHDYFLTTINGDRLKVCHKMFINSLALGEDCVKRWLKQGTSERRSSTSDRDEFSDASPEIIKQKKITRQTLNRQKLSNAVIEWLDLIPKVPSHYCRASTTRQYVDNAFLSKQNMYNIFKNWCSENGKQPLNLKAFKSILQEQKISIHKPRKDQCDICVGYKCGTVSHDEYSSHRNKEEAGRAAKARLKENANDETLVVTMDLQSVLTCPKLLASKSYYKLKLQIHNFTIYALNNKHVDLYVWHEANGGVSSNEFTSCVIHYLTCNVNKNRKISTFVLISDGCNYQNRNKILASALNDFAVEKKVTIHQLILEKGHTMMEADSVHSTLEHYFYPPINSPSDYVARIRMARPSLPYNVNVLDHSFFFNMS